MIDITVPHVGGFYWWDDKPPVVKMSSSEKFTIGYLYMSLHSGTHVDLPMHVGLDQEVVLKDIYSVQVVGIDKLYEVDLAGVDGILIKTGQGLSLMNRTIDKDYVALNEEKAHYLVSKKMLLVGIEAPSIERYSGDGYIHTLFLKKGIPILENINLESVREGKYKMFLFTLSIVDTVDALPAVAKLVHVGRDE
ncbi:hypothetical protein GM182_02415 [bacterium 3DAC]|nr:hypothetical protein [Dictyoglomota bacterium]UZN22781.1 hypothetical protein GM182_02415 [bacterium 3DAC]